MSRFRHGKKFDDKKLFIIVFVNELTLQRASFNVAQDTIPCTLLEMWPYGAQTTSKFCLSDQISGRIEDTSDAFTPVDNAVHLRSNHPGHMVIPDVNRAKGSPVNMCQFRELLTLMSKEHLSARCLGVF